MNPQSLSNLAAGSPSWLHALILGALIVHIGAGIVAILAGFAAMLVRKGSGLHHAAGNLFVAAMLIMAAMAVFLAFRIPQRGNIGGGALAFYLVATAWMTVRRKEGTIGRFEIAAFLGALGIAAMMLVFGLQAAASATGRLDGYPPAPYLFIAALASLFAAFDLDMILRGGVSGTRRIARHLGRMGLALFVASGSFFIGQQKVMPAWMHGSPVLLALGAAPLALTIFWLIRIRLGLPGRETASAPQGALSLQAEGN
jgi:uncharacterized membrane protein